MMSGLPYLSAAAVQHGEHAMLPHPSKPRSREQGSVILHPALYSARARCCRLLSVRLAVFVPVCTVHKD